MRRTWQLFLCLGAAVSCSNGGSNLSTAPAVLTFRAPISLSTEQAPQGHVLVADANADGWLDVLTWGDETQQLNLSDPVQRGILRAREITGLPAINVRQVLWLDLSGDKAADLMLLDVDGRFRRFDSRFTKDKDPTTYDEVEIVGLGERSFDTFTLLDVNRDATLDVVAAARLDATTIHIDVYLGGDGAYDLAKRSMLRGEPARTPFDAPILYPSDVNNDGTWEIIVGADGLGIGALYDERGYTDLPNVDSSDAAASAHVDAGLVTRLDAGRPDAGSEDAGNSSPGLLRDSGGGDGSGDAARGEGVADEVNSAGVRFEPLVNDSDVSGSFVIADANGDGSPELFRFSSQAAAKVYVSRGNDSFRAVELSGVKRADIGCVEDFDNDTRLDVLASADALTLSLGKNAVGDFETRATLDSEPNARRIACVDIDADGDVDVLTSGPAGTKLYLNSLEPLGHEESHFYGVRFRGKQGNYAAVGTRVSVARDAGAQVREFVFAGRGASAPVPVLHFGLGTAEVIKQFQVVWPNGDTRKDNDWEADVTGTLLAP